MVMTPYSMLLNLLVPLPEANALKLPGRRWRRKSNPICLVSSDVDAIAEIIIVQEAACELEVWDADSDVLFETEKSPLTLAEYQYFKTIALKSAADFLALYKSIPDKNCSIKTARRTFYGQVPCTAEEMY